MVDDKPTPLQKRILVTVYCNSLIYSETDLAGLAKDHLLDTDVVENICQEMEVRGLIQRVSDNYSITEKGRSVIKVVMAGGVFDIIHPGHVFTLSSSRKMGDALVVSVARDKTVISIKEHDPLNSEDQRINLVNSLKSVDIAILGSEKNIFDTVERVRPDIIALGHDQKHDDKLVEDGASKRGVSLKVVRIRSPIPDIKTSTILKDHTKTEEF